jgi:methylenetetrahydrofolate--tRNA-(uracil-5-)-methyltransferase
MPPNFGLLPELPEPIKGKRERYGAYRDRALADLEPFYSRAEHRTDQPLQAVHAG